MADPRPGLNFFDSNPDRRDFLQRALEKFRGGQQPVGQGGRDLESTITNTMGPFAGTGIGLGLSSLNEILFNQGKTDPRAHQRNLREIGRDTQNQRLTLQGNAAQRGLQNSGALAAIDASVGAAGGDRLARAESDETQRAEKRKRDDLLLMLQTLINPGLQASAITAQRDVGLAGGQAAQEGAYAQALAALFGGMGGG